MDNHEKTPFHVGESAIQEHIGIADYLLSVIKRFIRSEMPDQHREFFEALPIVMMGLADKEGYPWAIPMLGDEGFISSPTPKTLAFHGRTPLINAFDLKFSEGEKVGFLGLEFATRRRNRVNGTLGKITDQGFECIVDQSFGNCPKYIQKRTLKKVDGRLGDEANNEPSHEQSFLRSYKELAVDAKTNQVDIPDYIQVFIHQADTFFIASRSAEFNDDPRSGIDVSHRGGLPGFARLKGKRLFFPDYSGNRFFNTLGNIHVDSRVGLFFSDFATGDCLFLIGGARLHWQHDMMGQFAGAERLIEVDITRFVFLADYLPLRGESVEMSSTLPR